MVEINKNLSKKTIWNATSAYLMIFLSWFFLINKENPEINNSFVKSHTKTAILIHLWFIITYIIFISNWIFSSYSILWFWLNNIITDFIYILLLLLLIIWIYKSQKGETFNISDKLDISIEKDLLDIDWNWKITEKEKITIILSYIPFIWFITFGKYNKNKVIQDSTRLNIIITLILSLLFIFWYTNLATLFSLLYIILITFIWINLFTRDELISIKVAKILSPSNMYISIITIKDYLKKYFNEKGFKEFDIINKKNKEEFQKKELQEEKILSERKDFKWPKILIYIPIINLIFIFFIKTKYYCHIINWLIITLISIIILLLSILWYINSNIIILLLFPILFWLWYINNKLAYKIPIIFDIYILFKNIISIFKFSSKRLKEKRNEENEITLKIKK